MEISYDPSLLFLECVYRRDWLAFSFDFFAYSKLRREVVSSVLDLSLDMNSMDADLSHGYFVMEVYKPEKFS